MPKIIEQVLALSVVTLVLLLFVSWIAEPIAQLFNLKPWTQGAFFVVISSLSYLIVAVIAGAMSKMIAAVESLEQAILQLKDRDGAYSNGPTRVAEDFERMARKCPSLKFKKCYHPSVPDGYLSCSIHNCPLLSDL